MPIDLIKTKIVTSNKNYLDKKVAEFTLRHKYLIATNQTQKLVSERLNERHRRYNKTFGKKKANAINKMEHV